MEHGTETILGCERRRRCATPREDVVVLAPPRARRKTREIPRSISVPTPSDTGQQQRRAAVSVGHRCPATDNIALSAAGRRQESVSENKSLGSRGGGMQKNTHRSRVVPCGPARR
eukprot:scaffold219113_cov36-Tisochrysis_lutea.AAC.1